MLKVAGAGPGNPEYLTKDVEQEIKNAENILAFGRIAESLKDIRQDIIKVEKVAEVLDFLKEDRDTLLLASGDPNFFGIVSFLKNKGIEIESVLPGISSFQYMMCKLQKSWEDAKFLSLHGRKDDLNIVRDHDLSIILIDKDNLPSSISKTLYELRIKGKMYVGFNLSYSDEKIIKVNIGEKIDDISSLGVVVIENEVD